MSAPELTATLPVLGLPGQNGQYTVVPEYPVGDPRNTNAPQGLPGEYLVVFTFARPGYLLLPEGQIKAGTLLTGDSHLRLHDLTTIKATLESGDVIDCSFEVNDKRCLARVRLKCTAVTARDAYCKGHKAVTPMLSLFSLRFDIPISIYQVDVVEEHTQTLTFTSRNPFPVASVEGSFTGVYRPEMRIYASIYREALISESIAYQFLCYYRIAESLFARRKRLEREAKKGGSAYIDPGEIYPEDGKKTEDLYEQVFPVLLPNSQLAPILAIPEAIGRTFKNLVFGELKSIRDGIAHTFVQDGAELTSHDDPGSRANIEKWLPVLKLIARAMLVKDFGKNFV